MRVFGITTVHNAASTIRINVLPHLALRMERILVLDNGSTDAVCPRVRSPVTGTASAPGL